MTDKRFKSALIAMSPDADPAKHRSLIKTESYELISLLVRNEDEAVKAAQELVRKDGVQSLILCPGFTNVGIGRLAEALGKGVSINVARGDGPSNAVAQRAMSEAGWFAHQ